MKRKYLILGIISAVFLLLTTSCSSNPETFSVAEYGKYYDSSNFPNGYYMYYIISAPSEYREYVNTSVFYPDGNSYVGNMWEHSCKQSIEDALNSHKFHTFPAGWDGNVYICLDKKI